MYVEIEIDDYTLCEIRIDTDEMDKSDIKMTLKIIREDIFTDEMFTAHRTVVNMHTGEVMEDTYDDELDEGEV